MIPVRIIDRTNGRKLPYKFKRRIIRYACFSHQHVTSDENQIGGFVPDCLQQLLIIGTIGTVVQIT